jgi:hypothetical protein
MRHSKTKKKSRVKKHGGTVLDTGFKYTESVERAVWSEKLYPLGAVVVSLLPKIEWDEYIFHDYTPLVVLSSQESISFSMNEPEFSIQSHLVKATCRLSCAYSIFGGAACELYQSTFPGAANLHDSTDPTGDIDAMIHSTKYTVESKGVSEEDSMLPLYMDGTYTPFGEDYTSWLFDQVSEGLKKVEVNFRDKEFSRPELKELDEGYDKSLYIGNLLLSRTVREDKNIKLQVSTKVTTEFGTKVDHLLELIMLQVFETNEPECISLRTIPFGSVVLKVKSPYVLLNEQIESLKVRASLGNTKTYIHKIKNHCGRIVYLAKLLKYLSRHKSPLVPFPGFSKQSVVSMVKKIKDAGLKNGVCDSLVDDFIDATGFTGKIEY